MVEPICARIMRATVLAGAIWVVAMPAQAQQILVARPAQHDKVRVSAFLWRARPEGTVDLNELATVPGFEHGVDVGSGLGFEDPANGWSFEGNVAAGRRHRLIFAYSRVDASGAASIDFPGLGPVPPLVIEAATDIGLREMHGFYNLLLTASPQAEFGVLAGIGWFETRSALATNIGSATAVLDQAFPSIGVNLMLNPKGPLRGYVELTGFPRVKIEDLSGSQADLNVRFEAFPTRNFGVMVGYRRYRLKFDEEAGNVGFDLIWEGFTFGAQVRY